MTRGQMPFSGLTASDVIASILKTEPPLQNLYSAEDPPELIRIIKKTLQKKPDERYQLAKELALDLKNFCRDLEINKEIERSVPPSVRHGSSSGSGIRPIYQSSERETQIIAPHATSSAEYLFREIKQHRTGVLAGLLIFSVLVALAGLALFLLWPRANSESPPMPIRLARLTTTGSASRAAIS